MTPASSSPTSSARNGTAGGIAAVIVWSLAAPVIALAVGIDPFFYVMLTDGAATLVFAGLWLARRQNPLPELRALPWWLYALGVFGIGIHNVTWVAALQQAPPLEATLLIYTWPVLLIFFTTLSLGQRLRWFHAVAAALGLLGICSLLAGRGLDLSSFQLMPGHFWAIVSALSWAIYSAIAARFTGAGSSYLGVVFGLSALLNGSIWVFVLGAPPAPLPSIIIAVVAGIFFAFAYAWWDFGMKKGNTQLIGAVSFLTPVLSASYLVLIGKAALTPQLILALSFVIAGIAFAKYGDQIRLRRRQPA